MAHIGDIMSTFTFDNVEETTATKTGINKDMLMKMALFGSMGGNDDNGSNPMGNPMMMFALLGNKGGDLLGGDLTTNPLLKNMLPEEIHGAGMTFDGTIVLDGHAIKINEEGFANVTTTEGLQIDMPLLAMPTKLNDIKKGDIVKYNDEYIAVKSVDAENNKVTGLTIGRNDITSRIISSSAFGTQNIKKVFNPFGSTGEMNPMMAMMLIG